MTTIPTNNDIERSDLGVFYLSVSFLLVFSTLLLFFTSGLLSASPIETTETRVSQTTAPPPETEPQYIECRGVIFIDPGHGFLNIHGTLDRGAGQNTYFYHYSDGMFEYQLVMYISRKIADVLTERGFTVLMTRDGGMDTTMSRARRIAMAYEADSILFLSIHADAFAHSNPDVARSAQGARIYFNRNNPHGYGEKSYIFSRYLARAIDYTQGASTRQTLLVPNQNFTELQAAMPSALIEVLFLTNPQDAAKAATPEWQYLMARTLAYGIENFVATRLE